MRVSKRAMVYATLFDGLDSFEKIIHLVVSVNETLGASIEKIIRINRVIKRRDTNYSGIVRDFCNALRCFNAANTVNMGID